MAETLRGGGGGLRPGQLRKKELFLEHFFPTFQISTSIMLEGGSEVRS